MCSAKSWKGIAQRRIINETNPPTALALRITIAAQRAT
jgi:hypothetical protein